MSEKRVPRAVAGETATGDKAVELLRRLDASKVAGPRPASATERLMARAIDLGLLTLVALIAFGTAGLLTGLFFGGLKQEDLTRREWTGGLIATLIASAVWVGCFAWSEFIGIGRRGQTVGQRMYGVTIVTAEDEPPGVLRAILRSGSWIVPLFLGAVAWPGVSDSANPFAMLVIVVASLSIPGWALFDRKGRGLHDHLTGTRAVVNR